MERNSKDIEVATAHKELADREAEVSQDVHHKSKQERRLVLKQDLSIVLLLSGCYWFAYLDRGALGNARVMGLQTDLSLSSRQFYNCLMMFFVGYMIFELPAALSLRFFHPNWAYGTAVVLFGVFACGMSVARSYVSLMVLRLFIGLAEAYVQTGYVFLSLWYRREELNTRAAFYFGSAPVAGAISGLIAYGVDNDLDGNLGKTSWEWFFLIEGVLTVAWGVLVVVFMPKLPETVAKSGSLIFRDPQEHELILQRTFLAGNTPDAKPRLFQVWWALKDFKTWLFALAVAAPCLDVAAFGAFLPTFIKEFGFPALQTQLYSMIPYAFATFTLPIVAITADRTDKRAVPFLLCLSTSVTGLIILMATTNKTALVAGCCFVAAGCYPAIVIGSVWLMNSHAGYTKRSTAWAITQIFIQCYSIISTQIYNEPPRYFKGHGVLLAFNTLGVVAAVVLYFRMRHENAKKNRLVEEYAARGEEHPDLNKTFEEMCDYHPSFRYKL